MSFQNFFCHIQFCLFGQISISQSCIFVLFFKLQFSFQWIHLICFFIKVFCELFCQFLSESETDRKAVAPRMWLRSNLLNLSAPILRSWPQYLRNWENRHSSLNKDRSKLSRIKTIKMSKSLESFVRHPYFSNLMT